jgi:DNA (cytosine-5)-methyltransferase 1
MAGADADVPDGGWRNTGVVAGASGLVEWSVLDAQWFGLAQRRKRVFLVRDTGEWASRPPVLFERESLSGHPAPRREAGQVAPTVPSRRTAGDGLGSDFDCDGWLIPSVAGCLETTSHDYSRADGFTMIAHTVRAVRRLTPRELERLQGFSDDYTLIPYRGKPAADGNRYKALGNSMAVPVMRWIGERIAEVEGVA